MRVVGGTAGGIALVAPRGAGTRPITDRVKETLFDILAPRVIGAHLLDLYAGSGAVGIEALSRGAASCLFVERDQKAVVAIGVNLERTHLAGRATVIRGDVERFLDGGGAAGRDLAILDPPYEERAILAPLQRLGHDLQERGMVVVKHFWRNDIPDVPGLVHRRTRRFGETSLTFLDRIGSTADGGNA